MLDQGIVVQLVAIWTFRAGGSSNLEELFWQLQLSNLAGLQKNSIFSAETSFLSRSNTFLHRLPARQVIKLHTLIYTNEDVFNDIYIMMECACDDDVLGYDVDYDHSMMGVEVPRCECVCRTSTSES